jgi:hypothetical protein
VVRGCLQHRTVEVQHAGKVGASQISQLIDLVVLFCATTEELDAGDLGGALTHQLFQANEVFKNRLNYVVGHILLAVHQFEPEHLETVAKQRVNRSGDVLSRSKKQMFSNLDSTRPPLKPSSVRQSKLVSSRDCCN